MNYLIIDTKMHSNLRQNNKIILNLTNIKLEKKKFKNCQIINLFNEFNFDTEFGPHFSKISQSLITKNKKSINYSMTEINFKNDIWISLAKFLFIKKKIGFTNKLVLYYGHDLKFCSILEKKYKTLFLLSQKRNFLFKNKIILKNFIFYLSFIKNFIFNLIIELYTSLLVNKLSIDEKIINNLILIRSSKIFYNNNFKLIENKKLKLDKITFLSRKNFEILKNLNSINDDYKFFKKKNIIFLEGYNSLLKIIFIYFKTFLNIFNISQILFFRSFLKKNFLFFEIKFYLDFLLDIAKQETAKSAIQSFLNKNKYTEKTRVIVSHFELVENRVCIGVLNKNKIETFGLQHCSIGNLNKWRFYYSLKSIFNSKKEFLPKKIFLEGSVYKTWFKKFYNKNDLHVVGALRIPKCPIRVNRGKNILFLPSVTYFEENKDQIKLIKKKFINKKVIMRAHPTLKNINFFLKKDKSKNFIDSIKKNKIQIVFVNDTGAIFESIFYGIQSYRLLSSYILNNIYTKRLIFNFDKKIKIFNHSYLKRISQNYIDAIDQKTLKKIESFIK